jgi:DNA recombination protein RmuC
MSQISSRERFSFLENTKKKLTEQFENIANRIFERSGNRVMNQNRLSLLNILTPFTKEIMSFKKKVDDVDIHDVKERASLQTEVNKLFELNKVMSTETHNLTKVLKGDNRLQGSWGELILERILESSGLRKGYEYESQVSYRGHNYSTLRPDVIVKLPGGKDVIIDSKVSLLHHDAYASSDNEENRKENLKKHIESIKKHVSKLSKKNYELISRVNSLDFILMFMPVESAFVLAIQHDNNLFQDAFKKRIIIVTPTTLLATLGIISNIWKYENSNKNAYHISNSASKMLDKFCNFVLDMEELGKQINKVQTYYDSSLRKLTTGRGNLIKQARDLKNLGVTMKKDFPDSILEKSQN